MFLVVLISQLIINFYYFWSECFLFFIRLHKKPAAHYESAATRKYIGGRTETIRSCSVESVKFARAMLDTNIKPMDKRDLLTAAVNAHKKYTVDVS